MYKRIIHNIVEEHFDECPTTPEMPPEEVYGMGGLRRKSIQAIPPTVRYRYYSNFLFYDWLWYFQEASDDILLGNSSKQALLSSKALLAASNISNLSRSSFGQGAGDMLAEYLRVLTQTALDIVGAMKAGANPTALKSQAVQQINNIATFLNTTSPALWTVDVATAYLVEWLDLVIARTEAVVAGNWSLELLKREELRDQTIKLSDYYAAGQVVPQLTPMAV